MQNLNQARFEKVVSEAKAKCAGNARCIRAIDRAVEQAETNPFMEYSNGELLVLSPSGEIYRANGVCQCKAYAKGQLCWHRTLAKLMKRYHEAEREGAATAAEVVRHRDGRMTYQGWQI